MRIVEISRKECIDLLNRVSIGRLACSKDDQPFVVPICFAHEKDHLYFFSTVGKKIQWMRKNPKVCLQVDEIAGRSRWASVVVIGSYVELDGRRHAAEIEHAKELLGQRAEWWELPLVERREHSGDSSLELVFFRVDIRSMTGLSGSPEAP
jgi:nitroimidazol reductase NimA-like FMN-containing flavoprotein (pyridoxamine 5'-phosphate oxidase superfamily)